VTRGIKRVPLLFCALLAVGASAAASEQFAIIIFPNSANVEISDVVFTDRGYPQYECLSFANKGEKTIARLRFEYFFFDRARKLLRTDYLNREGPFEAATEIDGPQPGERPDYEKYQNCQPFTLPGNAAITAAAVDRIEYADGTAWASATAAPEATPSP
jgi:hypothetical protein